MEPVIEFTDFSFQYFAQKKPTLKNINLTIHKGEKVLIIGPSGSGKSTLANCINGLIPFSYPGEMTGSCKVMGRETKELSLFEISQSVGTVLQDPDGQFLGLSVGEDIAFALENECVPQAEMKEIVRKTAEIVDMEDYLSHSPYELSGGQKQRVSFAGVTVHDVGILLFDEPLANLDPATGKTSIDLIDRIKKEYDKTVIIIEHRLEDVLYRDVDRILVVSEGQIVADMSPDELMEAAILPGLGIREPLWVTAMRYAGIPVTKELHPGRLETLDIPAVSAALRRWDAAQKPLPPAPEKPPILEARHVSFSYTREKQILKDISFTVREGEMLSIVGTNGAGKSTLAKVICGLVGDVEGELFLAGETMNGSTIKERSRHIGYVMQNPNQMICKPMIYDEVALGLRLSGFPEDEIRPKVEKALEVCGLLPFRSWPLSALSFGQKKRVTIASVLVMEPKIIILDEPTAGQDYRRYTDIMEFLKKLNEDGVTIIMITHDMHLMLEYTPHSLVIHDGQIIHDGTSVAALTTPSIAERASLKLTSLYELAGLCGLPDPERFVQHFIDYEQEVRHEG